MRRLLLPIGLLLSVSAACACGDKLMLMMRLRAAQLRLGHPVSILAYSRPDLPTSALVRQIQLQPAVRKAGHKFQFVDDRAGLDEALKAARYDLVLTDVTVADSLSQLAGSAPSRPVVVPVAYKSTKQEDSATQKKFHCLLKTPSSSDAYFEAIDQALQWRAKAVAR
jgi:hypothetical protein